MSVENVRLVLLPYAIGVYVCVFVCDMKGRTGYKGGWGGRVEKAKGEGHLTILDSTLPVYFAVLC